MDRCPLFLSKFILELFSRLLSKNGYLRTKYGDGKEFEYLKNQGFFIDINESCEFEKEWYKRFGTEKENLLLQTIEIITKLEIFIKIVKRIKNSQEIQQNKEKSLKMMFLKLSMHNVNSISKSYFNNNENKKISWKSLEEVIQNKYKQKEKHLKNISIYTNSFFNEVKEDFKIENIKTIKSWKKKELITKLSANFLISFATLYFISTIFFQIFQGLSLWNENLSQKIFLYIGFPLIGLLIISGISILIIYSINKKYKKLFAIGSNIDHKAITQKSQAYLKAYEILDEIHEMILKTVKKDENGEKTPTIWKIIFDFSLNNLNLELMNEIILFKNYIQTIRLYEDHKIFRSIDELLFVFKFSKEQQNKQFVKNLKNIFETVSDFGILIE